jgi:hypothetical protein
VDVTSSGRFWSDDDQHDGDDHHREQAADAIGQATQPIHVRRQCVAAIRPGERRPAQDEDRRPRRSLAGAGPRPESVIELLRPGRRWSGRGHDERHRSEQQDPIETDTVNSGWRHERHRDLQGAPMLKRASRARQQLIK